MPFAWDKGEEDFQTECDKIKRFLKKKKKVFTDNNRYK